MNKTRKWNRHRGGNSKEDQSLQEECPICYEPLKRKESDYKQKIFKTKCGHMFHVGCLHPICSVRPSNCPMCRTNLAKKEEGSNTDCSKINIKMILANDALTDYGIICIMRIYIREDFQLNHASKKETYLIENLRDVKFNWFDTDSYYNPQKMNTFEDMIKKKIDFFLQKYSSKSISKKSNSN